MRVLIADDNREIRSALGLVLRELWPTCEIAEAADGAEAVQALETRAPDLILLDWSLTGADAKRLVGSIRNSHPGCAIVAMSSRLEDRADSAESGAHDFVGTSGPPAHLFEVLGRLGFASDQ